MAHSECKDIIAAREKIGVLQREIADKQKELANLCELVDSHLTIGTCGDCDKVTHDERTLSNDDISRYSRQLILPQFGRTGQERLMKSHVVVVGAGGLACSALLYLCAAGVGHVTVVDDDVIDMSNLARQVVHDQFKMAAGVDKVGSVVSSVSSVSPQCRVTPVRRRVVTCDDVLSLLTSDVDLVLDCTDNAPTRYLLSDCCVLRGVPLVSGAALRLEGQLTVYNVSCQSPCLRCVLPVPPSPLNSTSCDEGGVLGAVPGMIGVLQAIEAIKVLLGRYDDCLHGTLLFYNALSVKPFTTVKLSAARQCSLCSARQTGRLTQSDVEALHTTPPPSCGPLTHLPPHRRCTPAQYAALRFSRHPHRLLDVRPPHEYTICSLPDSLNVPWDNVRQCLTAVEETWRDLPLVVVCRRGNDSQRAVVYLESRGVTDVRDVVGGLAAWARLVDTTFPVY